ncbi:lipoprotein precursor [Flavobacterium rivuli WB 3.3-2 = DSM 21788]|uniref:Lipoprotein n=1 Tax=Flavobacterium rivuli WB 3.3-2 = DSM 21788 TaxID=1121895 RepID=A0A0A2LYW8_9FLAO|nr:imelysin family protein [Flavobacterium rivuli]KGO85164.1 lipoprotein precursor [Flavobacterium rivuli WB 3.3-2 = DSM 21788]
MKKISLSLTLLAATGLFVAACSDDDNNNITNNDATKATVVENYANIVYANYKDAYDDAVELKTAINAFTASPTDANFTIAKTKWRESRETYGTTEAFRFANGPIDNELEYDAPEGLLNSWPLDENYIDYVLNTETNTIENGGIINRADLYPNITKQLLEELNGAESEASVSVGYHAIEFLLWGQDLTAPSENKPGQRVYTDYVDNGTTADNEGRRRDYLNICADLLIDNLNYLVQEWKPGGSYRTTFLALDKDVALVNIYLGIVTLSDSELPTERMTVALLNQSQEDEHSCFSDNTHRDIALNLQGIINVYEGKYGNIDGPSLQDLVKAANNDISTTTDTSIAGAKTKVSAILIPFDLAIDGGETSVEGAKVKVAAQQIRTMSQNFLAGAFALGLEVNPAE